jgi:hypothetical protein
MDGQQDPRPVQAIWKLDTVPPKTFLDVHPIDPSPFTSATFEVRPLRTPPHAARLWSSCMGTDGGRMMQAAGGHQ